MLVWIDKAVDFAQVLSQLPAKFEHTEHCSLGDLQRQVYTRTSERSKEQLRTIAGWKGGEGSQGWKGERRMEEGERGPAVI